MQQSLPLYFHISQLWLIYLSKLLLFVYFHPQNTRCHKTVHKEIEHAIIKTLPKSNKKMKKMFPQDNPSVQSTVINGVLLRIKN